MIRQPLLAAAVVAFLCGATSGTVAESSPSQSWKPGTIWHLAVESWSPASSDAKNLTQPDPQTSSRYRMKVVVTKAEKFGPSLCWQVYFLPDPGAPADLGGNYRLLVDQQTGEPRQVTRSKDRSLAALQEIGAIPVVTGTPRGYPLEVFSLLGPEEQTLEGPSGKLRLRRQVRDKEITLEATLQSGKDNEVHVRQKWVAGEPWWREYERTVNGQKDLSARFVDPANVVPAVPPQAPRLPGLGSDTRLHAKLDVLIDDPSLGDLLTRIQQATGVNLIAEDVVLQHRPPVGRISFRGVTAHWFMDYLARKGLNEGHWEKTENGYRLVGTVGSEVQPAPSSVWKNPWLIGGILVGMAVLVIGGIVFLKGRRDSVRNG